MSTPGTGSRATKSTESAERFTLAAAGAVIAALTAAAFWLSYAHLAEVAGQHGLANSPERQWAWPGTLDAFIVIGELLMLRAGLRKVTDWWAVALTAIGSVGSIVLNVAGVSGTGTDPVPVLDYVVAAVPPTAALLAFGVLMRQIHQHVAAPADEAPLPTEDVPGGEMAVRTTSGDQPSAQSGDGNGTAVPAGGDHRAEARPGGDRTSTVPEHRHGPQPVPAGADTPKATGTVPGPGTGDRQNRDRPGTVPTPNPGPHTVPVPPGDRPEGTDGPQHGDRPGTVTPAGTSNEPRTVPNPVPNIKSTSGDRPGHAPATVRNNGISGDRPRHDRTSSIPGTGDRQGTVPGTETDGPRPHPAPDGDQDKAGDRDGDRGNADPEDPPANPRRGPVPKPKRGTGNRVPDGSRTGRGPRSRPRLTEDEIVDRLRPHVRTALERDGNEAVTRVQLRAIMRAQQIPIRNDRLTPILARLRDDNTKTRSHR
ncbi:hypothetical protein GCM10010425_59350 [Streptomyces spororaveus]|uniref:DUF2637 domain-containing protein n=1 Tax=Streptomyces spororaveus TaxID=284039 RepID=A0ABQ3T751_9ACTN|nr:hypothetical protein Sspor_17550 [Streptomyces spororaveus]